MKDVQFDKTTEWINIYSISSSTKLYSDQVSAKKYKFWRSGSDIYFLTDKFDNYLGHIELDKGIIISSFSKLQSGFYTLMFTQIFANSELKQILSDTILNKDDIYFYETLTKTDNESTKNFKINILVNDEILPFNKDILLNSKSARVIVIEHICKFKVTNFIEK